MNEIPQQLSKTMEVKDTLELHARVRDWLQDDSKEPLVNYLSQALYENKIEKLSRFGNNLNVLGVNLTADDYTNLNECDSTCKPATFSRLDGQSVYGRVAVMPKLSNRGFNGFRQSSAGSSGGGSNKPPSKRRSERLG